MLLGLQMNKTNALFPQFQLQYKNLKFSFSKDDNFLCYLCFWLREVKACIIFRTRPQFTRHRLVTECRDIKRESEIGGLWQHRSEQCWHGAVSRYNLQCVHNKAYNWLTCYFFQLALTLIFREYRDSCYLVLHFLHVSY